MAQKIFTSSFHNRLSQYVRQGDAATIRDLSNIPFQVDDASVIDVQGYPDLSSIVLLKKNEDKNYLVQNSIALYEALPLKNYQASDLRLWSYLSLITFRDYMESIRPIKNDKSQSDYIITHYLGSGSSVKALLLNDISLLWWMAHLTKTEGVDPYKLTREAHSLQDYTRTLLQNVQGRNAKLRHAVLEYVTENPDLFSEKKEGKVRLICRYLNFQAGVTLLPFCSKQEIKDRINLFRQDIVDCKK
jgi:hypothetical protein